MNWLVKKLVGSMIAGIGWKLGVDAYDAIKEHVKKHGEKRKDKGAEDGEGVEHAEVVEVSKRAFVHE